MNDLEFDKNLEFMQKEYTKMLEREARVYKLNGKMYIDNEYCHGCGQWHPIMESKICMNGYYTWKCRGCWQKDDNGKR